MHANFLTLFRPLGVLGVASRRASPSPSIQSPKAWCLSCLASRSEPEIAPPPVPPVRRGTSPPYGPPEAARAAVPWTSLPWSSRLPGWVPLPQPSTGRTCGWCRTWSSLHGSFSLLVLGGRHFSTVLWPQCLLRLCCGSSVFQRSPLLPGGTLGASPRTLP